MKVIDLLNKIANGEEDLPDIIIVGVEEDKHYYNKDLKEYINQRTGEKLFEDGYGKFLKYHLNDEVEIINENNNLHLHRNVLFETETINLLQNIFEELEKIIDYLEENK